VEHCLDFWPHFKEIDLFCFPDVGHSGLQLFLAEQGKAVWGSRTGDIFEQNREHFMRTLAKCGLKVPPHKVYRGLEELSHNLRDAKDKYIKVSRWRGDCETRHWRSWKEDSGWLDWLAVQLGPFKNIMRFLVFDKIDTGTELGGDTINVDGQWPSLMLNGFEYKDNTYFAAVTPRDDMPEQIQDILDAFGPLLGEHHYRNQWSMEVREGNFIDATCRGGMPSTATQMKVWKNWPQMVWAGANGELVEPEPGYKFAIECMVKSKEDAGQWDEALISPELEPHLMLSSCCFVDEMYHFPPEDTRSGDLGWLCAAGDTPRETLDRAKKLCDLLPDGLDGNVEAMANLLKEIETAQEQGIDFTHQELPEPAEAIE